VRWESWLYDFCSELLFHRLGDSELAGPFTVSRTFLILSPVMPSHGRSYKFLQTTKYPDLSCHAA
jgi:hypothetical protein